MFFRIDKSLNHCHSTNIVAEMKNFNILMCFRVVIFVLFQKKQAMKNLVFYVFLVQCSCDQIRRFWSNVKHRRFPDAPFMGWRGSWYWSRKCWQTKKDFNNTIENSRGCKMDTSGIRNIVGCFGSFHVYKSILRNKSNLICQIMIDEKFILST